MDVLEGLARHVRVYCCSSLAAFALFRCAGGSAGMLLVGILTLTKAKSSRAKRRPARALAENVTVDPGRICVGVSAYSTH
jgi:hypothetical protein